MKNRDVIDALNNIDFDLIEDAGRVTRKTSVRRKVARWSSLAACVCLVLAGALLFPLFEKPPVVNFIDHTVAPWENLWVPGDELSVENHVSGGSVAQEAPATLAYKRGLGVVAKVVEILPDVYVNAASSSSTASKYHIIRLEILEELYGENIPKELYFRLYAHLDPSLDEYEYIVIGGLKQVGFEDYAMINLTQKRAESFTLMFECSSFSDRGAILPFKDGVFSLEHWKKDGWLNWFRGGSGWEDLTVESFCYGDEDFPAWDGCTLEDTKRAINSLRDPEKYRGITFDRVRTNEIFATDAQKEVLDYVKPYENGLFAQSAYCNNGAVWFIRNVGGFLTNEKIRMTDEGEIEYLGERFTQEDLASIQDLGAFVSSLDLDVLEPPHTKRHEQMTLLLRYLIGKYVKNEGKIYGVIQIHWTLLGRKYDGQYIYHDDLYYLVMPDGTSKIVERDELREYVGDEYTIDDGYECGVGKKWQYSES